MRATCSVDFARILARCAFPCFRSGGSRSSAPVVFACMVVPSVGQKRADLFSRPSRGCCASPWLRATSSDLCAPRRAGTPELRAIPRTPCIRRGLGRLYAGAVVLFVACGPLRPSLSLSRTVSTILSLSLSLSPAPSLCVRLPSQPVCYIDLSAHLALLRWLCSLV